VARWQRALQRTGGLSPLTGAALRVRRNRPYVGWTDGLPTALRARHGATRYVGVELECNAALLAALAGTGEGAEVAFARALRQSLRDAWAATHAVSRGEDAER
jgi:hypothetical protein